MRRRDKAKVRGFVMKSKKKKKYCACRDSCCRVGIWAFFSPHCLKNQFENKRKKNVCLCVAGIISSAFCGESRASDSQPSWQTGEERSKYKT